MEVVNKEIVRELRNINESFKEKFNIISNIDKTEIRNRLSDFGNFFKLKKLGKEELSNYNPMACVDGSVNRFGGSFPHYIDLFLGLSMVSGDESMSVFVSNINSPLLETIEEENSGEVRAKLLAEIEVDTAIKSTLETDLKFLLMDGNLIRYSILATEKFNQLVDACVSKGIIIAGFIKEAKTDTLSELVFNDTEVEIYDKDLLYGVLDEGEGYILFDKYSKKQERNISSMFLRGAYYPGVAGIEVLNSQKDYLKDIGNLCYSLTTSTSRGVPMIIDMVDKKVKLDDKLTEELIMSYLDRDIIQRVFVSERSLRRY